MFIKLWFLQTKKFNCFIMNLKVLKSLINVTCQLRKGVQKLNMIIDLSGIPLEELTTMREVGLVEIMTTHKSHIWTYALCKSNKMFL